MSEDPSYAQDPTLGQGRIVNKDFIECLVTALLGDEEVLQRYIKHAVEASLLMAQGDTDGANDHVMTFLDAIPFAAKTRGYGETWGEVPENESLGDALGRQPNVGELLDTLRIMGVRLRGTAAHGTDGFKVILEIFLNDKTW